MKTILFQGDSITDAERSREHNMNLGIGYPTLVSAELGLECPNQYRFLNKGVGGNRVVDVYARMKVDILNLKPDVISILVGVNDVWHEFMFQNGLDPEKYFKVYSILIEEIKEAMPDIKIMIMEPFVLKAGATEARWEEFRSGVQAMAVKAKEIAEKYNLVFIPLQEKFDKAAELAPNDFWLMDGVHPTAAGHEIIKREWIKNFKTL